MTSTLTYTLVAHSAQGLHIVATRDFNQIVHDTAAYLDQSGLAEWHLLVDGVEAGEYTMTRFTDRVFAALMDLRDAACTAKLN